MDQIVKIAHVSKSFGSAVAVDDVSLEVRRGQFVSLLGPSGCGKSTMLRMIAGFEKPDRGSIFIDGANMGGVPPHRRPANMVFQHYALFPHLNVFENLAFGLKRQGKPRTERRDQVHRFLELVGMSEFHDRYPSQLSGGQQQRVALARALVNQPKVLLLDEPLAALDLKLRKRMQVELKQLQRELGTSFIFVTHDQEEALALSDEIAVMQKGRLIQYGTGRGIYDKPNTEFVANFLGESNILKAKVHRAKGKFRLQIGEGNYILSLDDALREIDHGKEITISIRPEHLTLHDCANAADIPVVIGQLVNKVFLGGTYLAYVDIKQDTPLLVRGMNQDLFDTFSVGDNVGITCKPDRVRVVTE
jgi:spermidine/putrescine transport system ATP-binding protein